ncbi:MAG: GNAT family N-acetyltransferase [Burkholderiales bacterium]
MNGSAFALHPVADADAEALADLRVAAMRPSLEAVGRFDEARARRRLLDGFDAHCTRAIVAGGERVGFVVVRPAGDDLLLDHLYLAPSAQRAGLGSAVLRRVIDEARAAGRALRVGALKDSPANAFYAKHGFRLAATSEWDNHYLLPPAT